MTPEQRRLVEAHYRRQSSLSRAAVAAILRIWRTVEPAGFREALPTVAGLLAAAQMAAAAGSDEYVAALTGGSRKLEPRTFAGVTAEGGSLTGLLSQPVRSLYESTQAGLDYATALQRAEYSLTVMVDNEVIQAGTNATQVATTAEPEVQGYTRMLTRPSCSRCVILAGRWYRWDAGFQRHPACDCIGVPASEAQGVEDVMTDPKAYFASLSESEQDKAFGKSNARAIRDGADMSQVVNTGRKGGLYEFDTSDGRRLQATTSGANSRQGRAGRKIAVSNGLTVEQAMNPATQVRLTPKSIYQIAGDDRQAATDLLKRHGYIRSDWTPDFARSQRSLLADSGVVDTFGAR